MTPSMRTLYIERNGKAVPEQVSVPELKPDEVLVAVKAVSFNPIDSIQVQFKMAEDAGIGCNFAGEIVSIGENVTGWVVGDTTAGSVGGGDINHPSDGAFSDFIVVKAGLLFHLPGNLVADLSDDIPVGYPTSFEQASTLALTIETAAIAFEFYDSIPVLPNSQSGFVLVYSAAGSLGFSVCQLAKYIGYTVIGLASEKNFGDLQDIGVDYLFDYHSDNWQSKVKEIVGDDLTIAFDCYSKNESVNAVWDVLSSSKPAKLSVFLSVSNPVRAKPNATLEKVVYYHLFHDIKMLGPEKLVANPSMLPIVPSILKHLDEVYAAKAFKAQRTKVVGNSLKYIPHGLELMSKGVSNEKLVVRFK